MVALLHLLASDPTGHAYSDRQSALWLRDLITSWPVQAVLIFMYVGLAVVAFRNVARDWEDGPRKRYFRAAIVALGVFIVLEFVLGQTLLGVVMWPTLLYVIEMVWLFALWLYYFVRFVTRPRSGPGDDETRRRGAALEHVIAPMSDEAQREAGRAASGYVNRERGIQEAAEKIDTVLRTAPAG